MESVGNGNIKKEYEELQAKLSQAEPVFVGKEMVLAKKKKELLEEIISIDKKIKDDNEVIEKNEDPALVLLAKEEIDEFEKKRGKLIAEEKTLNPQEKADENGEEKINAVIMEIRAGAGGEEASLFAQELHRLYSKYADSQGFAQKVLESRQSDLKGFKEVVFEIKGKDVYDKLKQEAGVHRVQRIPDTEKKGRVHTSTVSVAVLPQSKKNFIDIKSGDIKVEYYRSSGPGGQNVNKRETAVRVIHIPTGLVATCQMERSQEENRVRAMAILKARLFEKQRQEEETKLKKERKSQIGTADRSEKIRTYNFPQDRITDHRIKKNWHNIEEIMEGDLGRVIKDFKKQEADKEKNGSL